MRKLPLLVFGVAVGFVAAHFVNQNPSGRRFLERVNRGTEEVAKAFANGYRAAERDQLDEEFDRTLDSLGEQS